MFLSRTVAAEVCMEARVNEQAYAALKKLGEAGELRFDLSYVQTAKIMYFVGLYFIFVFSTLVEDLIKVC
jgi:hypothetical protein